MSSDTIETVSVQVSKENLEAHDLLPGDSVTLEFSIGVESAYHVIANLKTGGIIEKSVGYVTSGLNAHDLIVVRDNDVEFSVIQTK
jgi:hypothetical protein